MRRFAIPLVCLAGLGLSACGSDDKKDAATKSTGSTKSTMSGSTFETVVPVDLDEYSIVPGTKKVPIGKVTFNATNDGKTEHELVIIKTDKSAADLGTGNTVPEDGSVGEIPEFGPGKQESKSFELQAGHYALICNIPTHYAQGMRVDFTVDVKAP